MIGLCHLRANILPGRKFEFHRTIRLGFHIANTFDFADLARSSSASPRTRRTTRCEPTRRDCRFSGVSSATLPLLIIRTRSQICCASVRMWVESRTGAILADLTDHVTHLNDLSGVETNGGLIEDQYLRAMDQCLRQADTLSHAFGKITDIAVGSVLQVDFSRVS